MKRIIPRLVAFDHGVEYGQQLAHARHQGDLLEFARTQEALVELLYDRVVSGRHQRGHVQRGAQGGSPTTDAAFALQAT